MRASTALCGRGWSSAVSKRHVTAKASRDTSHAQTDAGCRNTFADSSTNLACRKVVQAGDANRPCLQHDGLLLRIGIVEREGQVAAVWTSPTGGRLSSQGTHASLPNQQSIHAALVQNAVRHHTGDGTTEPQSGISLDVSHDRQSAQLPRGSELTVGVAATSTSAV